MSPIKFFPTCLILIFCQIKCQNIENNVPGSQGKGGFEVPLFGQCDRIAMKGVMDCIENFLPNRVFFDETSGGLCCAYSKYKSCILGLNNGLRTSMERAKCPRSYATQIIMSFSENVVGFSLRILCEGNDGKAQCQPPKNRRDI